MLKRTLYADWDTYDGGWLDYDKLTAPMAKEILEAVVGPMIANGTSRSVFSCKYDSNVVLKFQKSYGQQNAMEAHVWERYRNDPRVSRWLAPIYSRSSNNRVIVQARTMPLVSRPRKLPAFLNDHKVQNYGILNGRVVCHDYGIISLVGSTKLEPVQWWDGETLKDYVEGERGGESRT